MIIILKFLHSGRTPQLEVVDEFPLTSFLTNCPGRTNFKKQTITNIFN